MENRKVLLSVKDLHVNFKVRGRTLSAIRGVSLDFYEGESVAIVGESGSGKSVFTKTFAGMLDSNGYIDQGSIIFNDEELADTTVALDNAAKAAIAKAEASLNESSKLEAGAATFRAMIELESEKKARENLSEEEYHATTERINALNFQKTELFNQRQSIDSKAEKAKYKEMGEQIKAMEAEIVKLEKEREADIKAHKEAVKNDTAYMTAYNEKMAALKAQYQQETNCEITAAQKERMNRSW